jgi:hypothetical protein
MEAAGEIVVIRPQKPVVVDRIERDIKKLTIAKVCGVTVEDVFYLQEEDEDGEK